MRVRQLATHSHSHANSSRVTDKGRDHKLCGNIENINQTKQLCVGRRAEAGEEPFALSERHLPNNKVASFRHTHTKRHSSHTHPYIRTTTKKKRDEESISCVDDNKASDEESVSC